MKILHFFILASLPLATAHAASDSTCPIEFPQTNLCARVLNYSSVLRGVTSRSFLISVWDRDLGSPFDGPYLDAPGTLSVRVTSTTFGESDRPVVVTSDVIDDDGLSRAIGHYRASPIEMPGLGTWKVTLRIHGRDNRVIDQATTYVQQDRRERYE